MVASTTASESAVRARVAVVCFLLSSCACGASEPGDAGVDAPDSPDSGRGDAGRDGSRDAPDAEAEVPDDAAVDEAGWVAIEGYPAGCELAYATNPAALFMPAWAPCVGVAACEWLQPETAYPVRAYGSRDARHFEGGLGYFATYLSLDGASGSREITVIARSEGAPVAALRLARSRLSDGGFCTSVGGLSGPGLVRDLNHFDSEAVDIRHQLFHGPFADWDARLPEPIAITPAMVPAGNIAQQFKASDTTVAFDVQPRGHIVIIEGDRWVIRGGRTGAVTGAPTEMAMHGHDVFWMSWYEGPAGDEVWLVHASIDREEHVLVRVPGTKLWGIATDGNHLCWVVETERRMGRPYRGDLYCSPYATESAELAPRLVHAGLPTVIAGVVGDGLYGADEYDSVVHANTLFVADIEAATLSTWSPPAAWRLGTPLWLTRDEIAVPMSAPMDSVVRLGLDALEPVP